MNINEFKPNSHKSKEEPKKNLEKVVTGGAIVRKKTPGKRFLDHLFAGDVESMRDYAVDEVILPGLLDLAFKTITESLEVLFYDGTRRSTNVSRRNEIGARKYHNPSSSYKGSLTSSSSNRVRADGYSRKYSLEQIEFDFMGDAKDVLERMNDILEEFPAVSGEDVCALIGKDPDFPDKKYGWTNLSAARIERTRGSDGMTKYVLVLPRAEVID